MLHRYILSLKKPLIIHIVSISCQDTDEKISTQAKSSYLDEVDFLYGKR